jgi:hypothetical protein
LGKPVLLIAACMSRNPAVCGLFANISCRANWAAAELRLSTNCDAGSSDLDCRVSCAASVLFAVV